MNVLENRLERIPKSQNLSLKEALVRRGLIVSMKPKAVADDSDRLDGQALAGLHPNTSSDPVRRQIGTRIVCPLLPALPSINSGLNSPRKKYGAPTILAACSAVKGSRLESR
jgi:hypothetical protein